MEAINNHMIGVAYRGEELHAGEKVFIVSKNKIGDRRLFVVAESSEVLNDLCSVILNKRLYEQCFSKVTLENTRDGPLSYFIVRCQRL